MLSAMFRCPLKLSRPIIRAASTDPNFQSGSGMPRPSRGFSSLRGILSSPYTLETRDSSLRNDRGRQPRSFLGFAPGFGPFGAVLGSPLLSVRHARGVQGAAHDVVADAGQVLHAAAA